jgi:hypothetical protein
VVEGRRGRRQAALGRHWAGTRHVDKQAGRQAGSGSLGDCIAGADARVKQGKQQQHQRRQNSREIFTD